MTLPRPALALAVLCAGACQSEADKAVPAPAPESAPAPEPEPDPAPQPGNSRTPPPLATVRVATFNVSLFRDAPGALVAELESGDSPHATAVAEIVQRVAPDVIVLAEVDHDAQGRAAQLLAERFVGVGPGAIDFPDRFAPPSNTGVASGHDLDHDGHHGGPGDCLGYGHFEGQYGFAVLSRHPIRTAQVRCFGTLRWRDMPGARLPDEPSTPEPGDWYDARARERLPLSSKNHCDVPIEVPVAGGPARVLHLLVSHPTPPVFDGPEDRNGRRNHDEIRLWAEYIGGAPWIVDDAGRRGGLDPSASFVIAGDLNADPVDGAGGGAAIAQLLQHARVVDPRPASDGGAAWAAAQAGANAAQLGDPRLDTGDFPDDDEGPGNLRLDYVLPSADLKVVAAGVEWPAPGSPHAEALRWFDHRPVWVDLAVGSPQ